VTFIDQHRNQFGVEPICQVLTECGWPIAPSTYRAARSRQPSARARREAALTEQINQVHAGNYSVYGARKVWLTLNREGTPVARCTVERLMREQGLRGVVRGRRVRTTIANPTADRAPDLVDRDFYATMPDRLWVGDITYVPTQAGTVYVAFVVDAYSRRILGWSADTNMRTSLVLDALNMATWTRNKAGATDLTGLIHHTDAGTQYTSITFTDRLHATGATPSIGSVGDAYDNALAESTIGLYKTELINRDAPWRDRDQVEVATLEYVDWYNHRRPHSGAGDLPPALLEDHYHQSRIAAKQDEHQLR
jgi:putative transposase